MQLLYDYKKESKDLDYDEFWSELSGDFDNKDKSHVKFLLEAVAMELGLDEYSIKRLETAIKTELPFFACKRLLAKKWLIENFQS